MAQPFRILLIWPLAATLAGCAVGPNFKPPAPEVPAAWAASASPPSSAQAGRFTEASANDGAWWTAFDDPELTSLVQRAAAANLDAKQAVLRIAEARAQRDIAASAGWPSLGADASAQVNRLSQSTPTGALFSKVGQFPGLSGVSIPNPYEQYQLGFDASWEIDLFGRVRRSVEAAKADTEASIEDSRAVVVSVLGEVARTYIDLRGAQARRQIVADTIATERDLLDLAGQRRQAGLGSDIEVVRAGAEASAAEAQLPSLDQQITVDINALSKLLALEPGALRAEFETAKPVPPTPPLAPIGLPADLARRRPDIREAEARLHAATARVGVAVGDLYPKLTLSAGGGYQSQSLSTLTHWASRFLSAGPTVDLPIFEGGRLRATVRLQDVKEKEAALAYSTTVLSALHEVDDALAAYGADQARQTSLSQTVNRNREAVDLARQRYASGVGAFIDVLDAERTRQQNALLLAQGTTAISTDLVVLYKALGGGWEILDPAAAEAP
jgi:NodT family efflux transporter outer membrane factor (OMF) lipoprotein